MASSPPPNGDQKERNKTDMPGDRGQVGRTHHPLAIWKPNIIYPFCIESVYPLPCVTLVICGLD